MTPDAQLFALLFGHVQSGKTNTFIMVALVLFLKYNLGTLAFLLNTGSAYTGITESVTAFNAMLETYGLTKSEAETISMTVTTLHDSKGLSDLQLQPHVPAMYGRILRASNVINGVGDGLKYVSKCGTDSEGYINAVLIVDEAHNVVASQNADVLRLEQAFHTTDLIQYRETMRDYMMVFYKKPDGSADTVLIDGILAKVDARGWQAKNLFKGLVFVTATPTPIALTETERSLQLLNVSLTQDYYGYDDSVPLERRIELVEETVDGPGHPSLPNIIAKAPWVMDRLDEYMAPAAGQQHVLVYTPGSNDGRVDLARTVACQYQEVPMVAICLFGRNGGYGACMVFSEAGAGIAREIAAADQALHCNKGDLHVSVGAKTSCGSKVMIKDGSLRRYRPPWGGHLHEAHAEGKAKLDLKAYVPYQGGQVAIPTIRFANNMQYRDRVLLDLVLAAAIRAGVPLEQLKVIGIGMQLLREGVTLKTTDHQLPPTAMLYTCPVTDDVKLIQATGRIAGRQQGGAPPKLHATKAVLHVLKQAYLRLQVCKQGILDGHREQLPPALMIARQAGIMTLAATNFLNPRNYNMPALRNLFAVQRNTLSSYHSLSAAEAKRQLAAVVDRVAQEQGWTFPRNYLNAIGTCQPAGSDYCCPEHDGDLDKWTECEECILAIAVRAIVRTMLTKASRPSRLQQFYQAITVIGYYAPAAQLSCLEGWPLDTDDETQPCWRDVAIGLGISEQYSRTLVGQIARMGGAEPSLVPLRRLGNGRWTVKADWWRYANDDDTVDSIDSIPIALTELKSGLPSLVDVGKLETYLASLQPQPNGVEEGPDNASDQGAAEPVAKRAHRALR